MAATAFWKHALAAMFTAFSVAWVQPAAWPAPPEAAVSRDDAVKTGRRLESSREWLEAIGHYEQAVDRWPKTETLEHGLRRSRFQFAISRRYTDRSFDTSLLNLPRRDASRMYDVLIVRVRASFVDNISLTSFVAHGTESLYLALANRQFAARNVAGSAPGAAKPAASDMAIAALRRRLFKDYWNRPVRSVAEARAVIDEVCDLAGRTAGISPGSVIMEYIFGGCNALDRYSGCMTPDRFAELNDSISGQFVGLGIEMKGIAGRGMLLVNVLSDSPARAAGLKPGDHVVSVDGRDCRDLSTDETANLLRGLSGSRVIIEVTRSGNPDRTLKLQLVRRPVVVKSIPLACLVDREQRIGYIQMTGFQRSSVRELDEALRRLKAQGMRALVWDVRHNPGGLLDTATDVLDRFIDSGVLVSTRGRTWDQNRSYQARSTGTLKLPLAVLTDGQSASASEIVAGAIRDHRRGVLVGRTTFGKWSVQTIFPIDRSCGLRLTTARFYSPAGHNLSKVGVKPDVEVAVDASGDGTFRRPTELTLGQDPDVRKALEILRDRLAGR